MSYLKPLLLFNFICQSLKPNRVKIVRESYFSFSHSGCVSLSGRNYSHYNFKSAVTCCEFIAPVYSTRKTNLKGGIFNYQKFNVISANRFDADRKRLSASSRAYASVHMKHSAKANRNAIIFDLDGVILRGGSVIEGAKEAINAARSNHVPYMFLTNNGGMSEVEKAVQLSELLGGVPISPCQVQLCHTPMRNFLSAYESKKVLVIGSNKYVDVMLQYGFQNVITPQQYHLENPIVYPFRNVASYLVKQENHNASKGYEYLQHQYPATCAYMNPELERHSLSSKNSAINNIITGDKTPISAIFIINDSIDWALDMQVVLDVLNPEVGGQHIPVYAGNADMLFSGQASHPRLGLGSFTYLLSTLYSTIYNKKLNIHYTGKPFKTAYDCALDNLCNIFIGQSRNKLQDKNIDPYTLFDAIYCIGDSIASDIAGANNMGGTWRSVLVGTGITKISNVDNSTKYVVREPQNSACCKSAADMRNNIAHVLETWKDPIYVSVPQSLEYPQPHYIYKTALQAVQAILSDSLH